MKKFILLIFSMCMTTVAACASTTSSVCVPPYDLSLGVGKYLANVTGSNFIGEKIAQSVIKRQLKKETGEIFKVKLESFSLSDLKSGRFKSLDIFGSSLNIDGIFISYLDFKTLCDFNYIVYDKESKTAFFKEAFPLSYSISFNESDINKTMNSTSYMRLLNNVNDFGSSMNLFKINDTSVKIRNNQFLYVFNYTLPLIGSTHDLIVSADLKVEDGEIVFQNTKITNKNFSIDISKLAKVLNYLNPLEFSLNILENNDTNVKVRNISVYNNTVNINGTLIVNKNVVKEHKD